LGTADFDPTIHFGDTVPSFSKKRAPGEVLGDATSLPSSLIEEWLLGHSDDPLNLPFVLFIERFSVPGQERKRPPASQLISQFP
jgi:hypothetical protein